MMTILGLIFVLIDAYLINDMINKKQTRIKCKDKPRNKNIKPIIVYVRFEIDTCTVFLKATAENVIQSESCETTYNFYKNIL